VAVCLPPVGAFFKIPVVNQYHTIVTFIADTAGTSLIAHNMHFTISSCNQRRKEVPYVKGQWLELLSTIDAIAVDASVHRLDEFVQTPKIFADGRLKERDGIVKDRGRGGFVVNAEILAIGDQSEQTIAVIPRNGATYSVESCVKVLKHLRKAGLSEW
jgi:hypothetical protein